MAVLKEELRCVRSRTLYVPRVGASKRARILFLFLCSPRGVFAPSPVTQMNYAGRISDNVRATVTTHSCLGLAADHENFLSERFHCFVEKKNLGRRALPFMTLTFKVTALKKECSSYRPPHSVPKGLDF